MHQEMLNSSEQTIEDTHTQSARLTKAANLDRIYAHFAIVGI